MPRVHICQLHVLGHRHTRRTEVSDHVFLHRCEPWRVYFPWVFAPCVCNPRVCRHLDANGCHCWTVSPKPQQSCWYDPGCRWYVHVNSITLFCNEELSIHLLVFELGDFLLDVFTFELCVNTPPTNRPDIFRGHS